jgi:hypothetical protein
MKSMVLGAVGRPGIKCGPGDAVHASALTSSQHAYVHMKARETYNSSRLKTGNTNNQKRSWLIDGLFVRIVSTLQR